MAGGSSGQRQRPTAAPTLVFTNEAGQDMPHVTIEHRFARVLESAGIQDHRFHDLRRTSAVRKPAGREQIWKRFRACWATAPIGFALDVYVHTTSDMHADAADKLQAC